MPTMRKHHKKLMKRVKTDLKLKTQDDLIEKTFGFRPKTRKERDKLYTEATCNTPTWQDSYELPPKELNMADLAESLLKG